MATIDIGGAGVGALLIAARVMDTLVSKGLMTPAEREQIIRDAVATTSGEMEAAVKAALQLVFPTLQL